MKISGFEKGRKKLDEREKLSKMKGKEREDRALKISGFVKGRKTWTEGKLSEIQEVSQGKDT